MNEPQVPKKEKHLQKIEASNKRYQESELGKASQERYQKSPKGKEARKKYLQSELGKATSLRYHLSEKGQKAQEQLKVTQKLLRAYHRYLQNFPNTTIEEFLVQFQEEERKR